MERVVATYELVLEGRRQKLRLERSEGRARVELGGKSLEVDVSQLSEGAFSLILEGRSHDVSVSPNAGGFQVVVDGESFQVGLVDPRRDGPSSSGGTAGSGPMAVSAPMPGKVVRILAAEGEEVRQGQGLVVVEAMKMQNELGSPRSGRIRSVRVAEGQAVNAGDPLVLVE
ncbi:MAG: acetyl-CoA carboxylase biotin carboxyl carrier protein subunit [Acidobacteria bacterium]|nr:acetyl-CoA carboxylase biotin carboxyl carrier protein subunit [Acidobacteriota bacterium]